jgi:hypothetical protein
LGVEGQHQQTVSTILLSATGAMKTWVESVGKESLKFKAFGDVALKAAENALLGRKSIPELDVAVRGGGDVDLKSVNQFMIQHIDEAVASRLRNMIASHSNGESYANLKKDPKAQQQLLENIRAVRCCVIQLEDGTFHYALETKTRDDNATPNAEVNALTSALERLTEARIKNVWVTEMRPEDIAKGSMHLSPKEGVERLVKRGTRRGDMHFNYIPFNSGELSNESLQAVTRQFAANDIFPAAFKGTKYIPSGDDTPAVARLG